jgi:DNA topoisomerase II
MQQYLDLTVLRSDGLDSDPNGENIQPVSKKTKAADRQVAVDKAGPSKTKPRAVSNGKKLPVMKRPVESDLEDSLVPIPTPPPRETVPKRTARGQAKKYIEVESDTGDEAEELDDSFVISD